MKDRLILFLIILLGIYLRLVNISPYKFYPDAYQNLLVALNIKQYYSVIGLLGNDGMLFPDFIAWTRAGYPLLINFANIFTSRETYAAQIVGFLSGVLAIPLAYLFIKQVFNSRLAAICGSIILATSFNHVVWGGFILTETTGVFISLIVLLLLFYRLNKKSLLADVFDLSLGVVLAFGSITRYEYIVYLLPIIFLILQHSPSPWNKVSNILISFFFSIAIFVKLLFPLNHVFNQTIISQIEKNLLQIFCFILGLILVLIFKRFLLSPKYLHKVSWTFLILLWLLPFLLIFQWPLHLIGFKNFFRSDLLLGLTSLLGLTLMVKDKKYLKLSVFVIFTSVMLFVIYYQLNPLVQRYTTHLIPVLLIPASFGFSWIIKYFKKNLFVIILIVGLVIYQVFTTFVGIKNWDDGTWFKTSYEEKSALLLKERTNDNDLLLVSLPESYYYHTNLSTYSIADRPPFFFINEKLDDRFIVIVQDMGMRDQFPNFSKYLDDNLQKYKIDQYWIGQDFKFRTRSEEEKYPVVVYKLKVKELREKIGVESLKN
jgi:hypothetical protein